MGYNIFFSYQMLFNDAPLFSLGSPVTDPPSYDLTILQGFNDVVDLFYFELFRYSYLLKDKEFHLKPSFRESSADDFLKTSSMTLSL